MNYAAAKTIATRCNPSLQRPLVIKKCSHHYLSHSDTCRDGINLLRVIFLVEFTAFTLCIM